MMKAKPASVVKSQRGCISKNSTVAASGRLGTVLISLSLILSMPQKLTNALLYPLEQRDFPFGYFFPLSFICLVGLFIASDVKSSFRSWALRRAGLHECK